MTECKFNYISPNMYLTIGFQGLTYGKQEPRGGRCTVSEPINCMKHGYCALKRRENNSTITLWQCSREEYITLTNFHIRPTNVWRKYLKLTYKNHAQTAFVHCHSMKRLPLWSCECWKELQDLGCCTYTHSQQKVLKMRLNALDTLILIK